MKESGEANVPVPVCVLLALIGLAIIFMLGYVSGIVEGRAITKREAAKKGHAVWIAGPEGEAEFEWLPSCKK